MPNVLSVDGEVADCTVNERELRITTLGREQKETTATLDDVIRIETNAIELNASTDQSKSTKPKWLCKVHYITRKKLIWKQATLCITGQVLECQQFVSDLQLHFQKVYDQRPKRLLVLVNPTSGGRYGHSNWRKVLPLFELAHITCDVKVSEREKHMEEIVTEYDLSTVDGIVVFGGDGSVSEVLNRVLRITNDKAGLNYNEMDGPFTANTIPIGTGNGMAAGLYGNHDIVTAALHIIKGNTRMLPLMAEYSSNELLGYSSAVTAYGLFTDMMYYTDQKRWMGRARYAIMPLYILLWKTQRLFNAEITIRTRQKKQADDEEETEVEEKLDGEFTTVGFFPGQVFGLTTGQMVALIYRQTPRLDFLRMISYQFTQQLPREEDFPTVTIRQPSSLRIKVNPKDLGDENCLNYMMHIDGEIHTMKEADVTIKLLSNACKVYSSMYTDTDSQAHITGDSANTSASVSPPDKKMATDNEELKNA
ncbi:ceramide kinase-like isoform X2 [Mizuhopecten yessoensis]|uniref:ceramide kinase-like isoform X2 n=1 Tax=Mizuhopecten yessoensis TaxID=6573 RepID=UPI000B459C50|nr:ceramide kinase-like isoform X2 [Mizuhopecten yessoensis]